MSRFTESIVEGAAPAWLESLGYAVLHGRGAECNDPNYREVVLELNRAVRQRPRQKRFTLEEHE